ncbi:hypothetical protein ILYODFUR_024922 [Ilyodon furcidens]|uniref:Uncharacterized protein n=1 Tax=Ilyodon furcidens TaxID=33524 RepID=A0ABV0ULS3_9TELE
MEQFFKPRLCFVHFMMTILKPQLEILYRPDQEDKMNLQEPKATCMGLQHPTNVLKAGGPTFGNKGVSFGWICSMT